MTNTHYLPGDRVRYNADRPGSLQDYHNAVGTFQHTKTLNPSTVTIDWDNAYQGKNSDHGISFIERQPIEPGCWVRELPGENIFSNPSKPVQVVSVDGYYAEFPGFLGGTLPIKLHRLARVAEPAIKAGDDNSIHLTPAEIQSKHDRVRWAENLIKQLPEKHEGRNSWLLNYGTKPVFKRGDLVTWGLGGWHGHIVGPAPSKDAPWEILITSSSSGVIYSETTGKFVTPTLNTLRHVEIK